MYIEGYIVPVLFSIIFVAGVVGNGTLIYTVLRNKKMRNVPNVHIVSLAAGDLLLILISVPLAAAVFALDHWIFGTALCKFYYFMQTLSVGVSVFTLTALSGDRFRVIVMPMSRHTGNPNLCTYLTAGLIWIASSLLAIPDLVSSGTSLIPNTTEPMYYCDRFNTDWGPTYLKAYFAITFCIYFALPVLIIAFFYVMMARMLLKSSHLIPGDNSQQRQIEARKKVAKVVLAFVVIFVICWFPRHIYLLWYYFDPNDFNEFWLAFKTIGFCLCFINSCVNPLALYFLSRQFRKHYNEYLFCCCAKSRYAAVDQSASMYNFNSTVSRTSTNMTMVHSQSMC
ncbi:neuropeptide CCHamide-1 receptor-like [Liolophura sinensis]|uniref:neuropeptide CCHamide-1 receptor-like n=1 Tax=Liolophura sinensis TaxID=3198878 RepID=UPI0031588809